MSTDWKLRKRDFNEEKKKCAVVSAPTRLHPFSSNWKSKQKGKENSKTASFAPVIEDAPLPSVTNKKKEETFVDPLGASGEDYLTEGDPLGGLGGDPLSSPNSYFVDPLRKSKKIVAAAFADTSIALQQETVTASGPSSGPASSGVWKASKSKILQNYTVSENVQIKCSFLNANSAQEDEGYLGESVKAKMPQKSQNNTQSKVDAKTQRRLDELNDPSKESAREFRMMNMNEYISHLESLNSELKVAWKNEERVKSLRIVIQCAKLLDDVSVAVFYPSMFVLVTEILDTFGDLVFERIKNRSFEVSGKNLRDNFVADDVDVQARETCKNWFFKIASIREIVPRLYVEMAILPCARFITTGDHLATLSRMSAMIRGVSSPLISVYLRAYLGRRGALICDALSSITPPNSDYLLSSLSDFFLRYKKFENSAEKKMIVENQKLTFEEYMHLMSPALDWTMYCLGFNANKKLYSLLLKKYCDGCTNSLILHSIISAFPPKLIASTSQGLIHLIRDCSTESLPQYWLFGALGDQLNKLPQVPTAQDDIDLTGQPGLIILNEVWKLVSKYEDIKAYMYCASIFIVFVLKYRRVKEIDVLVSDILKHVKKEKNIENYSNELKKVVLSIIENKESDFLEVLRLDSFQKVLDQFKGQDRNDVYKFVMRKFVEDPQPVLADPILIHTLLHVGKSLHDSLDSLSFSDEQRQIADLIKFFISKITFGTDFEQQLNFYLECRAAFSNLFQVKKHLIHLVLSVLMKTYSFVKGRHTKRTAAFAKACLAYNHITIPSLQSVIDRLELYLYCAQASLINQFLPQTDTFAMTAISLIPEFAAVASAEGGEDRLVKFIQTLVGWLVVVPGNPEHGPFFLANGVFAVVEKYNWEKKENQLKVLISLINLFATFSQSKLPYSVDRVVSNDELFAVEETYQSELLPLLHKVLEFAVQITREINQQSRKSVAIHSLQMLNTILTVLQFNDSAVTLAVELYQMVASISPLSGSEKIYLSNTRKYIELTEHLGPLHVALTKAGQ